MPKLPGRPHHSRKGLRDSSNEEQGDKKEVMDGPKRRQAKSGEAVKGTKEDEQHGIRQDTEIEKLSRRSRYEHSRTQRSKN